MDRLPTIEPVDVETRVAVAAATDAGGRHGNEDAVHVMELPALSTSDGSAAAGFVLAVADGMGGHDRGEVASNIAVQTIRESFANGGIADAAQSMKQAFRHANEQIYERSETDGQDDSTRMGTTLVAVVLRGKYATIANVGDSRAYLIRANRLTQITKDHSLVAERMAQGSLTSAEARQSPQRNILTHALGQQAKLDGKLPSIYEVTLLAEDRLLVCTDGFYDVVSDEDMLQTVLTDEPELAVRRLVNLAIERGTADNVSAVVAAVAPARERREVAVGPGADQRSYLIPALIVAAVLVIAIVVAYLTLV